MQDFSYRSLTLEEITKLEQKGCSSSDWTRVKVLDNLDTSRFKNVVFSGDVKMGVFNESFTDSAGVTLESGIKDAHIHNCVIGSNVYIRNIGEYIANYIIEDNVVIKNCGKIYVNGPTSFGNGTSVAVMNETDGRSVPIWDRLSAHEAYIIALYRHRIKAIKKLVEFNQAYTESVTSNVGRIGHNAILNSCSLIKNVKIGPYTKIKGAVRLVDGSINSCEEAPVRIGAGVIMEHFIVCSGSQISESTLIDKCFIGQGCILGKHYSAENSLFFANCGGYHGEACSIFAGPYTVTHHKSTLLIAGIFSFMNAGSGSNQSNHMYKLGPIHQGIMERGSKTTSDSYVLWPARIGPFTLVMGRHTKNVDTSSLPFSYLIENKDDSILVPGVNLRSVGTIRDARKWPRRDLRKDPNRIDKVNFNLLSPYTIKKMFDGRQILRNLQEQCGKDTPCYYYNNMKINGSSLKKGLEYYQMGINKFLGNSLIKRLENINFKSNEEIQDRLAYHSEIGADRWVDLAGLITPKSVVDKLLDDIELGKIDSVESMEEQFDKMYKSYYDWEWNWASRRLEEEEGKPITQFTAADVIRIVENWQKCVVGLDKLLYEDAHKEFTLSSMTGFGIDGGDEEKRLDFEEVRGDFESNGVVAEIKDHIKKKTELGNEIIARMHNVISK